LLAGGGERVKGGVVELGRGGEPVSTQRGTPCVHYQEKEKTGGPVVGGIKGKLQNINQPKGP